MTSVALSQLFFFGGTRRQPQWAPRKLLSSGAYSKIPFLERVYLRAHTVWWPAEVSSQKMPPEPRSTLAFGCHTSPVNLTISDSSAGFNYARHARCRIGIGVTLEKHAQQHIYFNEYPKHVMLLDCLLLLMRRNGCSAAFRAPVA